LKICHVIESAAGGSARVMIELAKYSARAGHDVHIIYSPTRADRQFAEALESVNAASVTPCRIKRSVGLTDLGSGLRLRRAVRRLGKLDVIHAHSSKAGLLARVFCRGLAKTQIYSPHGFYSMGPNRHPAYGYVERLLAPLCDKVVAVSAQEAQHALKIGIAAEKVSIVPNGIAPYPSLTRTEARARLGLAEDAFVVGFVGRLDHQKNPVLAVEVASKLRSLPMVAMCMLGDGPLRADVEAAVAARGVESTVTLAGHCDARLVMRAFDCLLSTSQYEGMPVAFLEALACGIPIISPPVGGAFELVVPFQTGSIRAQEASALAAGIREVRRWLDLRADDIQARCRAKAAHYGLDALGLRTMRLYSEMKSEQASSYWPPLAQDLPQLGGDLRLQ
jgi:glycosyltransferase involved in cell wall biosynthesis